MNTKMKEYENFYENVEEANRRLRDTVVTYEGAPYYVLCITNHRDDGIFRVYLDPLGNQMNMARQRYPLPSCSGYTEDYKKLGKDMDKFMDDNKDCGILRKTMNSPAFNKFRPFPLGMTNDSGCAVFLERQPLRPATQQGLADTMLTANCLYLETETKLKAPRINTTSDCVYDCVLGNYPSARQALESLLDPNVQNTSIAFHRNFALARGPVETVFLFYKTDCIGLLPYGDFSSVVLAGKFAYTKEVVQELYLFDSISIP